MLQMGTNIPGVFIDARYDPKNPAELNEFKKNTEKLWAFATTSERFACKDVVEALTELRTVQVSIHKNNY